MVSKANLVLTTNIMQSQDSIKIFISHSSRDKEIVEAIIDFLRDTLLIPSREIRCTSVAGYKLSSGASIDETLRKEVKLSEAFIGLISPASLRSTYVMCELGARWGFKKHLIPLLAPNVQVSELKPPLTSKDALRCDNNDDLSRLVEDLGK